MKLLALLLLFVIVPDACAGGSVDEGIRLYTLGQFNQAVKALSQARDASPDDHTVRFWLGKSHLKTREWDKAVHEMEKAVQLQPSNAKYHLWLGRACGSKASNTIFFKALGWARRVVTEFETARQIAPDDVDVRFDLLEYYLEAPGIVGGGRAKAEAEALAITKLNPRKGYLARSTILSKDKKWDLAQKELLQATIYFPDDADAFKDLADFLLERKDYRSALEYGEKALALRKESKRIQFIVAAAETQLRTDLDGSAKTLLALAAGPLTDGDPSFEEVYYRLGEYYIVTGDKAKAREAFASALTYNRDYDKAKKQLSSLK